MDRLYFDVWTCVLYVTWGMLCVLFINGFMNPTIKVQRSKVYTFLFFITLLFLAVFRKVTYNIGGSDTINYIDNFLTIFKGGIDRGDNNTDLEWGFQTVTRLIRSFTDNYRVYFVFIYGIIVYGYIKFIKNSCPKGLVYIPFILLMYPFVRSFNTMRTSVAIAFILMGISCMDKSKWKSLLLILSSVLFHRISLMFVFVWPFYMIINKTIPNISKGQFVKLSLAGILVIFLISLQVQQYAILFQVVEGNDASYIQANLGQNYLTRYPLFFGQLMLFVLLIIYYNSIKWDKKNVLLRILFIYDLWMVPAGLVLGMWRSVEYLYFVRLSLWSVLLYAMTKNKPRDYGTIIKSTFFIVFIAWLVFRIYKEYEDLKISPYIFDIL